jgi:hypothetical protein
MGHGSSLRAAALAPRWLGVASVKTIVSPTVSGHGATGRSERGEISANLAPQRPPGRAELKGLPPLSPFPRLPLGMSIPAPGSWGKGP